MQFIKHEMLSKTQPAQQNKQNKNWILVLESKERTKKADKDYHFKYVLWTRSGEKKQQKKQELQ